MPRQCPTSPTATAAPLQRVQDAETTTTTSPPPPPPLIPEQDTRPATAMGPSSSSSENETMIAPSRSPPWSRHSSPQREQDVSPVSRKHLKDLVHRAFRKKMAKYARMYAQSAYIPPRPVYYQYYASPAVPAVPAPRAPPAPLALPAPSINGAPAPPSSNRRALLGAGRIRPGESRSHQIRQPANVPVPPTSPAYVPAPELPAYVPAPPISPAYVPAPALPAYMPAPPTPPTYMPALPPYVPAPPPGYMPGYIVPQGWPFRY
ncbi:uncharacterized protein [Temnothorax nylanderi]|uniref:uncharacterized protein n=1 Tax=Temnothorax nylanderi TaxID=102681 RepID=UPI003A8A01EF